jgi:1-acyl-sn-glycerol-3-phosphate acyltransferase
MLRALLRLVMRVFYRQITVVGLEHIPSGEPVIFAGNHPNSLIDPVLIVTTCGRIVSFAAKDVLFKSRLLRVVLRAMGAVPIARRDDHGQVAGQNDKAFAAMFEILKDNAAIGIFPEGLSHDESQLARLKTGAARLALAASEKNGAPVKVVPCGLSFIHRKRFRSRVLVQYGPPIEVDARRLAAFREDGPTAVRALTADLERALRGLTVNAEDWETVRVLDGVRRLYQPPGISIEERVELARRFNAHYPAVKDRPEVRAFFGRVAAYLDRLDAVGLTDRDLRDEVSSGRALWKTLRYLALILFWLPLAAPGAVLHIPVVWFARVAGRTLAPRKDVVATTKMIVGILTVLLAYAALVGGAAWKLGLPAAAAVAVLFPLSGYATLKVLDRSASLRRGLHTLLSTLRLRAEVAELRAERGALEAEVVRLVDAHRPADLELLFPRAAT